MIKIFEDFKKRNTTINKICKQYNITNYTINPDGSVDVYGNVNLAKKTLVELPLKFSSVSGYFNCNHNQLTTLEGCPSFVGNDFYCNGNNLISLEGSPIYVADNFDCRNNNLTTLKGAPKKVEYGFYFSDNQLPQILDDNKDYIKYIIYNQDDYGIWRTDGSFNEFRFDMMMKEKDMK